jgi:hypothetical protein
MIFGLMAGAYLQARFGREGTIRVIAVVAALELGSHFVRGFMGWT